MAKPTAPTELGGTKTMFAVDNTAVTPTVYGAAAVQKATTSEATYPTSWWGFATHRDGDTVTEPGGFTTLSTAAGPVVLIAGKDGTTVRAIAVNADGEVGIHDGGNSITVDGSITLAAGTANIGDVDVLTVPAPLSTTGGGTEATALRVTLANDSTGLLSVDDNSGSLTVDAPVGTPVNVQIGDGTLTATVRDTGTSDSLNVAIVDASGNQITSFGGGGVQYTEGDIDATFMGTLMLMEGAGDTALPLQGSIANGLLVDLGTNNDVTVSGTVAATQSGTWNLTNISGTISLPTGAATAALQTQPGVDIGDVTVNNAAGAAAVNIQDGGNSITVDGTIAATQSGTWNIGTVTTVTAVTAITNALPAGTNNIGDVDVLTVPAPLSTTGGGTEATALRVTLANDSTGLVSVDDNSGSLTVDAPVGTPVNVQIGDGTRTATVRDTGTSDSLNVAIVDASGNQITTFGGTGGTSSTDDGAFTAGSGLGTPMMGFATTDAVDAGDVGVVGMTATRGLFVNLRDDAGDSCMDGTNDAVRVNIVAGSSAGTEYTEGDVDATITGTAMLMEEATNTLRPIQGTVADGLLVNLGTNNDVTVTSGSITANAGTNLNTSLLALESGGNLAGAATSLAILDDWDESDRAKVNPIAGQAGVQGASGVVTALTQRVVLATDVALPAGTNNIGDVDIITMPDVVLAAGTNNIGDVDVLSVIPGTGATNLGKAQHDAFAPGDVGVMALGVVNDTTTPAVFSPTQGDYVPIAVDSRGWVEVNPGFSAESLGKKHGFPRSAGDVGVFALAVRNDLNGQNATTGEYQQITADAYGRLRVVVEQTSGDQDSKAIGHEEDAAHTSGDLGVMSLAVRKDAPVNLSGADGDYEPLQVSGGRLWASVVVEGSCNTSTLATAISVGASATALPTSALTSRKRLVVQNKSTAQSIFVGGSGVTTSSGMEIPVGWSQAFEAGPSNAIYGIVASGSADVRVLELS